MAFRSHRSTLLVICAIERPDRETRSKRALFPLTIYDLFTSACSASISTVPGQRTKQNVLIEPSVASPSSPRHWVLKLLDQCGLDEQHIRGSATSAFMRTKLGFVSSDEDVRDLFERPLFQLIFTALPASSGCAASISARVIAPIEGARFVYDKKPLQKHTYVTIWENMYGEGGRAIYEPHEQITARIEATIDTLINEFAEAWTHSQGIGHPKYGAP